MHFVCYFCTYSLCFRSRASGYALRANTLVPKTCDLSAGAAGVRFAYYFCTYNLCFRSRASGNALRAATLVLKTCDLPEMRERASHTTFCTYNLQMLCRSCGSALSVLTRNRESRRASHETASKQRFASEENRKPDGAAARAFAESKTHSYGATARALRHAGSLQRVRRAQDKVARRHSQSASTRRISAEGLPRARRIRTALQQERLDTKDLRKGFTARKANSHGATARALRHAQSTHNLRKGFAELKPHSHGATARAPRRAKGSLSSRNVCK